MKVSDIVQTLIENVPNQSMNDLEHDRAREETGYWGKAGSGGMIIAKDTGRILLPLRSVDVEEPNTWGGTWGGAIDSGMSPKESAIKEIGEETGYTNILEMIPLNVFKDGDFRYFNYLALVDKEFTPKLNWETSKSAWTDFGNWPSPAHFGLTYILDDKDALEKIKTVTTQHTQT